MKELVKICDWCPPNAKRELAISSARIQILGSKTIDLDFCTPHLGAFTNLLRQGLGQRALKHPLRRDAVAVQRPASKFKLIDIERAILRHLSKQSEPLIAKRITPAISIGSEGQRFKALQQLVQRGLVGTSGMKNQPSYALTKEGRAMTRRKNIVNALGPFYPTMDIAPKLRAAILRSLSTSKWMTAHDWPKLLAKVPGAPAATRRAIKTLRGQGIIEMEGTRNRARYRLAKRAHPRAPRPTTKKAAPAPAGTSASESARAARRLRVGAGRRRHPGRAR
jgi:predicted transcriptional regulator